jgi:hypothetical protein
VLDISANLWYNNFRGSAGSKFTLVVQTHVLRVLKIIYKLLDIRTTLCYSN